ncbi:MAG: glycosyltransferase family 4 protein [Methanomassiliicoccales archaeon]|nr:MAG: glycosyltransferase family 4 protein [Methanomassiliicoccales archaeon]
MGGVETRVLEVTSRLVKSYKLNVVTSDLKMERPYQKLSQKENVTRYKDVPITRLPTKKILPLEGYGVTLKGLKEALQPAELIDTHTYGTYHSDKAVKIAKKRGIPSILTTHLHPAAFARHKMLRTLYDGAVGKKTLQRCNIIITMTEIEKDYLVKRFGISRDKMETIPSGIDLTRFRDMGYEREDNSLLFVGRLSPVKRLDMLFRAIAKVKRTIPDVKLKIIGKDWGVKEQLVQLSAQLDIKDNVEFLGQVTAEELIEHYNRTKAYVLVSKYEALGVTIMEAIGCGTPAVVTGVGGVPEVVGDCGILCEENKESVEQAISEILRDENKYRVLKDNTKKRRKQFDWNHIALKVKAVYDRTLELT